MITSFVHSFQSEWLKKKRSLASWLVVIGGFFTPTIVIIIRLIRPEYLPEIYASELFWNSLWTDCWEVMSIMLLPVGVILATSLITQLEYKNNTWKQVHTVPISAGILFFSKLSVIVVMMLQFFILFNLGIFLAALVPLIFTSGISYPDAGIPVLHFLKQNIKFFIDCLPIISLQYLVSLKFKNFLVPVGMGLALWIASMMALSWKYGYTIPYTYTMFNFLMSNGKAQLNVNVHMLALGYFLLFTLIGFLLFISKKDKG